MNIATRGGLAAAFTFPVLLLLWGSAIGQSSTALPLPARNGTRGPIALAFRADGRQLYVAEQDENDVSVLDMESGLPLAHIPSGGEQPTSLALAPDGKTLVVANTFSGSVGILDVEKRTLTARVPLLGEPSGVAVTSDGRAWVSAAQLDQVAVIDIAHAKILQRISVGHVPRTVAVSPDGNTLVCANSLGGSLSLIDIATSRERRRIPLPAINLRGLAFTPDGLHVWVTGQQPHNELPTERPEVLWSNVLCEVSLKGKGKQAAGSHVGALLAAPNNSAVSANNTAPNNTAPNNNPIPNPPLMDGIGIEQMLVLDRAEQGASDPCGIVLDAKGTTAFVTLSGMHEVAVVPLSSPPGSTSVSHAVPNSATVSSGVLTSVPDTSALKPVFKSDGGEIDPYLPVVQVGERVRRLRVGCNPRALALRPHTSELWVGNHLGNSLTALAEPSAPGSRIAGEPTGSGENKPGGENKAGGQEPKLLRLLDLGTPTPNPNRRLRGRFFFASAHVTRGQFFSCESCHPNGGTDGLAWKFAHVKDGMDARNTKDLRGLLLLTAPYGWGGREEDFEVFVHDEVGGLLKTRKLEHPEVHALWDLVNETPLPPNPYRNTDGTLTAAALHGKTLFTGQGGCVHCHVGEMHGGTKKREWIGTTPKDVTVDVPHLVGAYQSAPYLHDGRAATLEDIFTKYNPEHLHGSADTLTPAQLKDLLEYVREL